MICNSHVARSFSPERHRRLWQHFENEGPKICSLSSDDDGSFSAFLNLKKNVRLLEAVISNQNHSTYSKLRGIIGKNDIHTFHIVPSNKLSCVITILDRRVPKNWRDIYFLMFTRPGHFFLKPFCGSNSGQKLAY